MQQIKQCALSLFMLMLLSSQTHAASGFTPRLSYQTAYNDSATFIGNTVYLGVGMLDIQQAILSGFSLRYGWGDTGDKYNLSYMFGSAYMAFELGISQINQSPDSPPLFNGKHKGEAVELSVRYQVAQFILIRSEQQLTLEVGVGF